MWQDLGRNGITSVTITIKGPGFMGFTVRIASLGYELLNNPMEQDTFVEIRLAQFDEIIAMKWGVVVKTYGESLS